MEGKHTSLLFNGLFGRHQATEDFAKVTEAPAVTTAGAHAHARRA